VTISDYNRGLLRSRCPALEIGAVSVVHCGVTVERDMPARPRTGKVPSVLSVGRLVPIKGHGTLIEALQLLAQRDVRFRCRIVGGGPLEGTLRDKVREAGVRGVVEITGPQDHHEVEALLADSDVFALSCTQDSDGNMDGIPVALMEAMAHGLPVVSTTVSGVPELVTPDTGFLVPPEDPQQLAGALEMLLEDEELCMRMGEAGRARVSREFNTAEQARQMYSLLTRQDPPQ
jgi:colanic acid/amylovoran biosynthesis glycosyltransferase